MSWVAKIDLMSMDEMQKNEGQLWACPACRQQEHVNRGKAHCMNKIRILAQGELVVFYQRSVGHARILFRAPYKLLSAEQWWKDFC